MTLGGEAVYGRIDLDGRLTDADPPLLDLHRRAGGEEGGVVAIPQIAALARLARRLNILVSRPIVAADGDHDIDLWVRARPEADAVSLAIGGWTKRPARLIVPSLNRERDIDFLRASADWMWETDETMRLVDMTAGDGVPGAPAHLLGQPLSSVLRFIDDGKGGLPILNALAERRRFDGQTAEVRETGVMVRLAAVPLIDGRGEFSGFRGSAIHVEKPAEAPPVPVANAPDAFGETLSAALKGPLGRIVADAETIGSQEDGPLRRDYASYAGDIANAGRHLLSLIDDLADLEAIERPDFAVEPARIDLAELARRAVGLLAARAGERGVRIDAPNLDERLFATGDLRRTLQILVNLIGNAVQHSPDGGMVWVRAERDENLAVLVVADQGRGIDSANHQRVFEKFERLGSTVAGGSGLGLYIARRLARAMGGDIGIDSAPGQGARFVLTLPLGG
jgi:signal transduction histidine kinase